jgi:hypothetical protein
MKIRVSYFPRKWKIENLKAFFANYGPTEIMIEHDKNGFPVAVITIPDNRKANNAIYECNKVQPDPMNFKLRLRVEAFQESRFPRPDVYNSNETLDEPLFPYRFVARGDQLSKSVPPFHDQLDADRYDVAFEITWEAISTVAANPCLTNGPACFPKNLNDKDTFYAGYNKRWLTINNRLAISPFTVKSAIASGFANLMGGCYRINPKTEIHDRSKKFFLHEDTIPSIHICCKDMNILCPRCQMFGMTDQSGNVNLDAVGYCGRFKSAALLSDILLDTEESFIQRIPVESETGECNYLDATMTQWGCNGVVKCRQYLMRIASSPKPEKLDVDGYFNHRKKILKGVKNYLHGTKGAGSLEDWSKSIEEIDSSRDKNGKFTISHKMRNYAVVCEKGVSFQGTVGGENCSQDEIAALLMLLEHTVAGHGFKIGLGKAWGLGSMVSSVKTVWVRQSGDYSWTSFSCRDMDCIQLVQEVDRLMPGVGSAIETFKNISDLTQKINPYIGHEKKRLKYPENLRNYWKEAKSTGLTP